MNDIKKNKRITEKDNKLKKERMKTKEERF